MADSTFPPLLFTPRSGSAAPLDYRASPLGVQWQQTGAPGGGAGAAGLGFGAGGGRGLERISPTSVVGVGGVGNTNPGGSSLFQHPQPGAHRPAFSRLGSSFRESTPRRRSATPAAVAAAAAEANTAAAAAAGAGGGAPGLFDSPAVGLVASQQQGQQHAFGGQGTAAAAAAAGGASRSPWQGGGAGAPPPPPSASMMAPSSASPLSQQGTPLAGVPAAATAAAAHESEENAEEDDDSCWVTAFGFPPADTALALEALASCGDVLAFGSGRGGECSTSSSSNSVNWIHVRFATRHQAARALAKDGCLLAGGRLLLGVRPLQPAHRGDAARVAAAAAAAAGSPSSGLHFFNGGGKGDGSLRAAPASASRLSRPYRVVLDGGSRAATERLPRPVLGFIGGGGGAGGIGSGAGGGGRSGGWAKIGELLFGL